AGRRSHGGKARLLWRSRACDLQGAGCYRPVWRGRDRFPVRTADLGRAGRRPDRVALSARRLPVQPHRGLYPRRPGRALAMAAALAQHGGAGLSLCLASAGAVKVLAVTAFTLAWTHSIEKVEWQEDWRITSAGLELTEARVKGSGAGMEPSPEARLVQGRFRWKPALPAMGEVTLRDSGTAGEWRAGVAGS